MTIYTMIYIYYRWRRVKAHVGVSRPDCNHALSTDASSVHRRCAYSARSLSPSSKGWVSEKCQKIYQIHSKKSLKLLAISSLDSLNSTPFVQFESEQNNPSFSLFIANLCGVVIFHDATRDILVDPSRIKIRVTRGNWKEGKSFKINLFPSSIRKKLQRIDVKFSWTLRLYIYIRDIAIFFFFKMKFMVYLFMAKYITYLFLSSKIYNILCFE